MRPGSARVDPRARRLEGLEKAKHLVRVAAIVVEPGDLVEVATEDYSPWFVVCHRVSSAEAYRRITELDVPEYTIKGAPADCDEYSILLEGFRRERAILVPSDEVRASGKAAWFPSGWA